MARQEGRRASAPCRGWRNRWRGDPYGAQYPRIYPMSLYLDTRGKTKVAIGICSRCSQKMAYSDMVTDGDSPGIRGHAHCMDMRDPWRLPARRPENITLQYPRPDVALSPDQE